MTTTAKPKVAQIFGNRRGFTVVSELKDAAVVGTASLGSIIVLMATRVLALARKNSGGKKC